jgi:3'-phosphoadenosine 5'-phosphosulfate sulfotransferase (PAPS reductase)/FAD synthetase
MNQELLNNSLAIMQEASDKAKEAGTPLIINFSGGKDSSVLILLAKQIKLDDIELLYMISRLELPGTIDFVKEQAARFDLPLHMVDPVEDYMGDFPYWVRRFNYFPGRQYTYCSSRLKLRPARKYFRKIYGRKHVYKVNGVRRSESSRRQKIYATKPVIRPDYEASGHFLVEPIRDWKGTDVAEYLKENNFEVQKLYEEVGVSGCAYCPFYQSEIYQRILNIYPNIYDEIIQLEDEIKKPSVNGGIFLHQLRDDFFANREEIMARLNEKGIKIKK